MNTKDLARAGAWAVGVGRAATGVFFVAAPKAGAKAWVGSTSTSTTYLSRAVGGRDLVIGGGLVRALVVDENPMPWVLASVIGDAVDSISGTALKDPYRKKTFALAGGFGLLGAATAFALSKAD